LLFLERDDLVHFCAETGQQHYIDYIGKSCNVPKEVLAKGGEERLQVVIKGLRTGAFMPKLVRLPVSCPECAIPVSDEDQSQ
jgi:hypothetical protein